MNREEALSAVLAELDRATVLWPNWPTDPVHANGIVQEEVGETLKEIMDITYKGASREAMQKEAVQAAAMSLRFLMSIDRYEFKPSPFHVQ